MTSKSIFFSLLVALILSVIGLKYGQISQNKPKSPSDRNCKNCNIFLLDIDILRADALPCYGYFRETAPNICAFAKKATIFTDNYTLATWTLPSAISAITSLHPAFHHVNNLYVDQLDPNIPTLAETLKQAGYQTALVREESMTAFLTDQNKGDRGYDLITSQPIEKVVNDLSTSSKPWFIHYYLGSLHLPFLLPTKDIVPIENLKQPAGFPVTFDDFRFVLNDYIKANALKIFQKKALVEYDSIIFAPKKSNDITVYELFYNLKEKGEKNLHPDEYLLDYMMPLFKAYIESFNANNPADLAYLRMMYDTKIKLVDTDLSWLLTKLSSPELVEKTTTIIFSEHGENFGEFGEFNHNPEKHSQLFFTPLIIKSPGLESQKINQPTSNLDIFPTILDIVGLPQPSALQGQSLKDANNNKNILDREFVISEDGEGTVIQNRTWFYYLPHFAKNISESILYNKLKDPQEKQNVVSANLDLTTRLYHRALTIQWYQEKWFNQNKTQIAPSIINIDPEKLNRMKKEGYF